MSCWIYSKLEAVSHIGYIAFLSVFGTLIARSAVFGFSNIACTEDAVAAVFTLSFAWLILSVDFCECRALGTWLHMDETGIRLRRFGRTLSSIRWEEIREIGTAKMPTAFGKKECVYFCSRKLEKNEKSDPVTLLYDAVSFPHLPKNWYSILDASSGSAAAVRALWADHESCREGEKTG